MTAGYLRQRGEARGCRGRPPRLLHGAAASRPAGGDDPAPGEEGGAGRGRGRRQGRHTLPQTLREAAQCGGSVLNAKLDILTVHSNYLNT